MCFVCLKDFTFKLPKNPNLEQKKKRLKYVKELLSMVINMDEEELFWFKEAIDELKEEQYLLSREF